MLIAPLQNYSRQAGSDWLKRRSVLVGLIATMLVIQTPIVAAGEDDPTVIVLFGDSTTTGINSNYNNESDRRANGTTTRGCPTIYLTNLLKDSAAVEPPEDCPTTIYNSPIFDGNGRKRDVIVANWGIGGSNTDTGVSRIISNLNSTKATHSGKDYHALIVYGTNDRDFSISTTTTEWNLRMMVQRAEQLGYTVALGTMTPRDDRDISPYNSAVMAAANAEGVPVVNHFARFISQSGGWRSIVEEEVFSLTGELVRLHPSDEGYMIIAETWFDQYLKDIIDPEPVVGIGAIFTLLLSD